MVRIQQQDKLLSIHSDWFSLLVPGVWEKRPASNAASVFEGANAARTLSVSTHTLPAAPTAELRTLGLRGILDSYAKNEAPGATIDEGPVETSPGGAILTLAYTVGADSGTVARVKLVCYGRRCVAVRLAADTAKDPHESRSLIEHDTEAILDGLSILQFERVSVAQLQRRMTWLLALNLFLFCGALLIAVKCYAPAEDVDVGTLRHRATAIPDVEAGRKALRESAEFFDFWNQQAAAFRREIAGLLLLGGGIAAANIAAFWWMRRIVRHPWDDIVDRE